MTGDLGRGPLAGAGAGGMLLDEFVDWEGPALRHDGVRLSSEQLYNLRKFITSKVPPSILDYFSDNPQREEIILGRIREALTSDKVLRAARDHPLPKATPDVVRQLYDDIIGLGPLEALLRDPTVTSVSVTRYDVIQVERGKDLSEHPEHFRDQAHLELVTENLAVTSGYNLTRKTSPRMTHFWKNPPARVHIDIATVDGGPYIGFRRGRAEPWTLDGLVQRRALSPEVAQLLTRLVRAEASMLFVGPPGSGKTTLMETVIGLLPERHVVIIEDGAYELHPRRRHQTHIVVEPRAAEGGGRTAGDMAEAAKSALRKNADQVVYGEILDGNAGHVIANAPSFRWSATTTHGIDAQSGLARFSVLASLDNTVPRSPYVSLPNILVRKDIALGFKVVVLCGRLANDRQVVREIDWIDGVEEVTGNFRLTPLARLTEVMTPEGVDCAWEIDREWRLPEHYAVNLRAADLAAARRAAADGLTVADVQRQAMAALQVSDYQRASLYLLQALHMDETGLVSARTLAPDLTTLLTRVLQLGGQWPQLRAAAAALVPLVQDLQARRAWPALARVLAEVDGAIPLGLALDAQLDLREVRAAMLHGQRLDADVAARLEQARALAAGAHPLEALRQLLALPGEDYTAAHYRQVAALAKELFGRVEGGLAHPERVRLESQLARLRALAGETVADRRAAAEQSLSSILQEAEEAAAAVRQLYDAAAGPGPTDAACGAVGEREVL